MSAVLLRALALALRLHASTFDALLKPWANTQWKIAHYSSVGSGVGEHADSGLVTLLFQDAVGGLQFYSRGEKTWCDVPRRRGCAVVNLGEMLEIASDEYFVATYHRVQNRYQSRYSFPFFYNAALNTPIKTLVDASRLPWERDRHAPSMTQSERNRVLPLYGDNALKSLARSHPNVQLAFTAT